MEYTVMLIRSPEWLLCLLPPMEYTVMLIRSPEWLLCLLLPPDRPPGLGIRAPGHEGGACLGREESPAYGMHQEGYEGSTMWAVVYKTLGRRWLQWHQGGALSL
jgi:hypothetical protein